MFNIIKRSNPTLAEVTQAREEAEHRFNRLHALEHIYQILPLAQRLQAHRKLLARHNLFLALETDAKYPGLYVIHRDHSRWCRIWRCGSHGGFRLDATRKSSTDYDHDYHSLPWYDVMKVDLSANIDMAERCFVGMLQRGELRFGDAYLPAQLHDIDDITLPVLARPEVPALPPPPAQAVPRHAMSIRRAPEGLQAVPLLRPVGHKG